MMLARCRTRPLHQNTAKVNPLILAFSNSDYIHIVPHTAPPAELLKVAAVNVPVKLQTDEQDMTIRPGDYIIGDINGVVVLPKEIAEAAIPLMAKQVAADSAMAVEIAKGMTFTEASKKFR